MVLTLVDTGGGSMATRALFFDDEVSSGGVLRGTVHDSALANTRPPSIHTRQRVYHTPPQPRISAHTFAVSQGSPSFTPMPIARITITSVSDEGDQVIIRGTKGDDHTETAFVFQVKGDGADPGMAERASRLASGAEAIRWDWRLTQS